MEEGEREGRGIFFRKSAYMEGFGLLCNGWFWTTYTSLLGRGGGKEGNVGREVFL